jgi:small subunit ribosomal protein S8
MSVNDPIADLLVRLRNAMAREHAEVPVPASKLKVAVLRVLQEEGYIEGFEAREVDGKALLVVRPKYHGGRPAIRSMRRISKPGLRVYRGRDELGRVHGGYGVSIVSTPQGVMTDRAARRAGVGGEILCEVF